MPFTTRIAPWLQQELHGKALVHFIVGIVAIGLAINILLYFVLPDIGSANVPEEVWSNPVFARRLAFILVLFLPTAFLEELLFRAPLTIIARASPGNVAHFIAGSVLLAALFGFLHDGSIGLVFQGVSGLLFALIYCKAGGIHGKFKKPYLAVSLAHLSFNAVLFASVFAEVGIG